MQVQVQCMNIKVMYLGPATVYAGPSTVYLHSGKLPGSRYFDAVGEGAGTPLLPGKSIIKTFH